MWAKAAFRRAEASRGTRREPGGAITGGVPKFGWMKRQIGTATVIHRSASINAKFIHMHDKRLVTVAKHQAKYWPAWRCNPYLLICWPTVRNNESFKGQGSKTRVHDRCHIAFRLQGYDCASSGFGGWKWGEAYDDWLHCRPPDST